MKKKKFKKLASRLLELRTFILAFICIGTLCFGGVWGWTAVKKHSRSIKKNNKKHSLSRWEKKAWGYFYPGWEESGFWEVFQSKNSIQDLTSHSSIQSILKDPKGKISKEFRPSPALLPRVRFWVNVYARYDSRMKIVHDRHHPSIVYGFLDFRPLYRSIRNPTRRAIYIKRIEATVLDRLKSQIKDAFALNGKSNLPLDERIEFRAYLTKNGLIHPEQAKQAIKALRTQTGQRDHFIAAIKRAEQWLPHIENTLRHYKLPVELARIPFVESSFNIKAHSKIGALGIWQLMPNTAKEFIRTQDRRVWRDPVVQTKAAARLLRNYSRAIKNWGLTVTSYNSGIGRVQKIAKQNKIKTIEELLAYNGRGGLGFAGKNFYAEFLAANLVEAYRDVLFSGWMFPENHHLSPHMTFPDQICRFRRRKL